MICLGFTRTDGFMRGKFSNIKKTSIKSTAYPRWFFMIIPTHTWLHAHPHADPHFITTIPCCFPPMAPTVNGSKPNIIKTGDEGKSVESVDPVAGSPITAASLFRTQAKIKFQVKDISTGDVVQCHRCRCCCRLVELAHCHTSTHSRLTCP